ncbi:MAG TPA: PaaI family thioesterase [Gammaproteobacteria bacterium]|nr:PaaI family thioesterase [Gammaproteobacteria bacterium]
MTTIEEIQAFLAEEFPQTTARVEKVGGRGARVRQPIDYSHLRPGGTVSGPTMMALADVAAYVAIFGEIGIVPLAVTTSLSINFLNKPAAERDLVAEAELLKIGSRLVVADVRIYSVGEPAVLAQASVTYSIPPRAVG